MAIISLIMEVRSNMKNLFYFILFRENRSTSSEKNGRYTRLSTLSIRVSLVHSHVWCSNLYEAFPCKRCILFFKIWWLIQTTDLHVRWMRWSFSFSLLHSKRYGCSCFLDKISSNLLFINHRCYDIYMASNYSFIFLFVCSTCQYDRHHSYWSYSLFQSNSSYLFHDMFHVNLHIRDSRNVCAS